MYDPISVETALVSSGGDLLIQLTDGNVINAGRVRGMPGPKGDTGEQGIRGAHGRDGRDGTNGAKWHTGVGAPEIGLGEDGDLYMDVAASVLPIYQKVNGDWMFLANLKGGGAGGGVGATGDGAAGGGSSIIIKPGPTPPTNDNEGGAVSPGDLWWDSNTGLIYVNTINGWVAISDHPPAIVSPTPPDFTNNSDPNDPNKRYPIREGDLWMDSLQGALYVAMKNADDDIVWVISTPADRSILQEEIPVGGFVFPASTQDGDTVFNDVTGLWYVYNGAKNQWIDLPPGERELSYPGILREADPAIDETYEGEADAADGDVYLNSSDHETGTRLVVRKVDRKGFAWTDFIQGIAEGDGIALVQTNYDNGPDSPQTQRVDYLIVASIVENPDSFSIEVDYEQQNFNHDPLFGEEVSVRFLAQVSSPAVCVTYEEATPEPKCVGHLWFDSSDDQGALKIWNGEYWIPASPPTSLDGVNSVISSALEVQAEILARLDTGEAAQATLQDTVTDALDVQTTLVNRVEALEGTVIDGKWMLDNRSVAREGYFLGLAGAVAVQDWTLVTRLQMNPVDSTGKSFTFAEVSIDDVVRIGGVGGSAVFKMTSTFAQAGDVYEADVQLLSHSGVMAETLTYDFEFLPSFDPSTYATIDYVDAENAKYISKTGQQDLSTDIWKVRQPNADGNFRSFINIHNGNMNLYNVVDPSGSGHERWAATKGYVDDQIAAIPTVDLDNYLPLVGGDMTGRIDITMSNPTNAAIRTMGSINVKANNQEIGGSNNFIAHKDYVRVYSTPSGPQDVVNKEYLENYKKATVWTAVDPSTPAGNLQEGQFFVADNNNIYLHFKSSNGIDLGVSGGEHVVSMTYLASIYARGTYNSVYSTVADKINLNVSTNKYIRVQSLTLLYKQAMSVGTNYVINIPGFTP